MVSAAILIDGRAVPSDVEIYSIDIWQEINRIPRAKISILDGNLAEQTFRVSDEEWFLPGKSVEIQMGFGTEMDTIFKGIITAQSIKVRSTGSVLMVDCADPAIMLTTTPKSRYFYEKTESDAFETIISEYGGLTPEVQSTEFRFTELLQFQSTDWDFILTRAEINGMFCLAEAGKIIIKPPNFRQEPVADIRYGQNLYEFDAEMDAADQFESVKSTSWDYSKTEKSEVTAQSENPVIPGNVSPDELSEAFGNNEWILRAGSKIPAEVLQKWANARKMKQQLSKIRGRAKVQGSKVIKPGKIVSLSGVGSRFNGNAFVSGVKHTFNRGDWMSHVQIGMSPKWFSEEFNITESKAAGMLPAVNGLHAGLVTQIENDPDGDERILVRLPMIDAQEQGVWARLATSGAGNGRGVIIRPEIGDEVIVGFVHDDPNQPVILGALNSAANPAPINASDDNHEKGWITRGEIKLIINDETPSVLIEMPSGKIISMNDEDGVIKLSDEFGNSLKMSDGGIVMDSRADISVKTTGDLNLEGINVNIKANASITAEGSASAELSSSGSTSVKGSIVQIN